MEDTAATVGAHYHSGDASVAQKKDGEVLNKSSRVTGEWGSI